MSRRSFRILLSLAGLLGGLLVATAAGAQADRPGTISVIATGDASAAPDIAFLSAGVEADGATAREALGRANEQIERVLAALRAFGIAPEDVQTEGLNVFTITSNPERGDNTPPRVIGYRASNTVSITARDITRVGALVDLVIAEGATNLNGVRFGIRDSEALKQQAIAEAVREARPLAQAAAAAANLRAGDVDSITEVGGFDQPTPAAASAQRGGDFVAPGSLTLRVQVRVTFRLTP